MVIYAVSTVALSSVSSALEGVVDGDAVEVFVGDLFGFSALLYIKVKS
jgi:hypothetical protein